MSGTFAHILVPTDFSPQSDAALACAKELARQCGARLSLLHVITDPRATGLWAPDVYVPASREMQATFLREATARLENAVSAEERAFFHVLLDARIGPAAECIRDFAREHDVDLIVMGTHGRTGLAHLLLGSVAERVLRSAPCPVMATRADVHQTPERKDTGAAELQAS